jgi:hypothetical protein
MEDTTGGGRDVVQIHEGDQFKWQEGTPVNALH